MPSKTAKPAKAAPKKPAAAKPAPKPRAKAPAARMSLAEVMRALEKAGSAQTKKTYLRHGATEPLFGVSFATLKEMTKRIGVDHALAVALWDTGNLDARNLAVKIADPAQMTSAELDRWARSGQPRMCGGYVAMLAAEGPHAAAKAAQWLGSKDRGESALAWTLLGQLAMRDTSTPDSWFLERLAHIEKSIHAAPNDQRYGMNQAVIMIGCRSAALRKAALAAAKRIGKVDVDHGDTDCKTPDAASYIEKTWAHSTSKGFESPAAHERERESPRLRC
jgi:3-methyladenine DNA glycosylase AlkD